MIEFHSVPLNVTKLATAYLLGDVGPKEFSALPVDQKVAFAREIGLSPTELADALSWLGDYYTRHGEALRRYAEKRRRN